MTSVSSQIPASARVSRGVHGGSATSGPDNCARRNQASAAAAAHATRKVSAEGTPRRIGAQIASAVST